MIWRADKKDSVISISRGLTVSSKAHFMLKIGTLKPQLRGVLSLRHWPRPDCRLSNLPVLWERQDGQKSREGWVAPPSLSHLRVFSSWTSSLELKAQFQHNLVVYSNTRMSFSVLINIWSQHSRSSFPFSLPRSFLSFLGFLSAPSSPVGTVDDTLWVVDRPEAPEGPEDNATGGKGRWALELGVGSSSPSDRDWYCNKDFSKNLKIKKWMNTMCH